MDAIYGTLRTYICFWFTQLKSRRLVTASIASLASSFIYTHFGDRNEQYAAIVGRKHLTVDIIVIIIIPPYRILAMSSQGRQVGRCTTNIIAHSLARVISSHHVIPFLPPSLYASIYCPLAGSGSKDAPVSSALCTAPNCLLPTSKMA